ncbi:MAG: tRNA (N(6)-L-threonylcarbamoyladenosine(37)-C(2))-methylthiotransferase [Candidatus Hermodarchaeota archaeon]
MERNTFYIETYGCVSNKSDSHIMATILNKSGYVTSTIEDAEFVIVNTCAVKQQTENKIKSRLNELFQKYKNETNKHFIIAGCLPHIDPKYIDVVRNLIPNFSAIIDLDNLNEIPSIFEEIRSGKTNIIVESKGALDKSETLIDYPKGKITGIVPISEGCLGSCTYCCVKNARGRLQCYNSHSIIENVDHQLRQGIKQIYLTSQDCSTYEYENTKLADLISDIVDLDYEFFLRIGMLNPKFIVDEVEQLISIFNHKKIYQLMHIPIQSGSDNILKLMNRNYRIMDVMDKLNSLRKKFPFLSISTDIICGFPGESEEDFNRTINLIKWLKPEILNVSKFTPRPGTAAKNMLQVDSKTIKRRSTVLSDIFRESLMEINTKWKNWEGEVLVLHKGLKKNQVFGRNFAYKNVFIGNFEGTYGSFVKARISKVEGFNLYAEIIN